MASFGEISQKRDPLTSYINNITSYYERGIDKINSDIRNGRLFKTELTEIGTGNVNLTFTDLLNGLIEIPDGGATATITMPNSTLSLDDLILLEKKIGNISVGTGLITYITNKNTTHTKTLSGNSGDFIGTDSIVLDTRGGINKSVGIIFTKIIGGTSNSVQVKYILSGPFSP